jgi:hypothetical protein
VRRDPALLVRAVAPLVADLRAALGPRWSCELVGGAAVRVRDGAAIDVTGPVDETFDPEESLPRGALGSPWRDEALEEEASHTLVGLVQDLVTEAGGPWPRCALHPGSSPLMVCSFTWLCPDHGHAVAPFGALTTG